MCGATRISSSVIVAAGGGSESAQAEPASANEQIVNEAFMAADNEHDSRETNITSTNNDRDSDSADMHLKFACL